MSCHYHLFTRHCGCASPAIYIDGTDNTAAAVAVTAAAVLLLTIITLLQLLVRVFGCSFIFLLLEIELKQRKIVKYFMGLVFG